MLSMMCCYHVLSCFVLRCLVMCLSVLFFLEFSVLYLPSVVLLRCHVSSCVFCVYSLVLFCVVFVVLCFCFVLSVLCCLVLCCVVCVELCCASCLCSVKLC